MKSPMERDISTLRQAVTGHIPELKIANQIICARTSSHIRQIKQAYNTTYDAHLENDIEAQASGNHKQVLSFSLDLFFSKLVLNHLLIIVMIVDAGIFKNNKV